MFFRRLIPNFYPQFDWIQVEISSYCNADCIYCPHTIYRENWQNKYLSIESFRNLIPAFQRASLVYLQGWGEPFTHSRFFEMLKTAKAAGCRVGTTTNGTLLDRKIIEALVSQGLDVIGFSLAGVDKKNDKIRKGTRIKKVLECIEEIHRTKDRFGTDKPEIHIAYMLLRSGLADLEKIPKFMGDAGASQTVISSLSFVASQEMEKEAILASDTVEYLDLKARLTEVRNEASNHLVDVHFHMVPPEQKNFSCMENIPKAVVVSSEGIISPCVMKQIPVKGKNYHYFRGQSQLQQNLSFGNIHKNSLNTIWNAHDYQQFVREFRQGETPTICKNCLKNCIDNFA